MKHSISHFYHIPEFLKNDSEAKFRIQYPTTDTQFCTLGQPGDGGAKEDRTPDLLRAKQALSQLSYGPNVNRSYDPATIGGSGQIRTADLTLIRGAL